MSVAYIHSDLRLFHQSFVVSLTDLVYILLDLIPSAFLPERTLWYCVFNFKFLAHCWHAGKPPTAAHEPASPASLAGLRFRCRLLGVFDTGNCVA